MFRVIGLLNEMAKTFGFGYGKSIAIGSNHSDRQRRAGSSELLLSRRKPRTRLPLQATCSSPYVPECLCDYVKHVPFSSNGEKSVKTQEYAYEETFFWRIGKLIMEGLLFGE